MDSEREAAPTATSRLTDDIALLRDPLDAGGETPPSVSAEGVPIEVSQDTIRRAGHALFILWLKIGATLVAARLLLLIWPALILLILSLMLVATFMPTVRRLQARLTRGWAITFVVTGMIGSIVGVLALMIPPLFHQAQNLLLKLPQYLTQIETSARKMGVPLKLHGSNFDLSQRAAHLGPEAFDILLTVFSGVTGILTVAVLTIYLLIDGQRVATSTLGLLPRKYRLPLRQMFGEIGAQIGHYMRGQLITSVLAGLFSYLLLLALRVPEPLPLAFLMAAADAIPIAGPLIGTIPAVLMAMTKDTPTAIFVLIGYVVYHQIESHILVPRIYGKTMKMPSAIVILAILIGVTLLGVLGALLALPAAAAIPVMYRYAQRWIHDEEEDRVSQERALP